MKLVLKLKLKTDPLTDALLRQTTEHYQRACNSLSQLAFDTKTFRAYDLHHLGYSAAKEQFELPAQLVVRAIAEVGSAYKSQMAKIDEHNRTCAPQERLSLQPVEFKPHPAVPYDARVMRLDTERHRVSLRTLRSRVWLEFQVGEKRQHLLASARGQADLKRYGKVWYLFQTIELPEPPAVETTNVLGVDVGICTIASTTDGREKQRFPGNQVRKTRQHHFELRRGLQHHNTPSSRRKVRTLGNREARMMRTTNHEIAFRIVKQAERTNSTIALEDLEGLRAGVKVSKGQRRERFSWSYAQLQEFIVYKAALAGIPFLFVPPDYTSKTCSRCHYMSDRNRPSQAWFTCQECGYCCHADDNAAENIRFLGAASACQKRVVCMQEYLHTDRRKPLRFRQR